MRALEIRKATKLAQKKIVLLRIPLERWVEIGDPKYFAVLTDGKRLIIVPVKV